MIVIPKAVTLMNNVSLDRHCHCIEGLYSRYPSHLPPPRVLHGIVNVNNTLSCQIIHTRFNEPMV